MFSTQSEQTTEHPCLFPHPTASREGQTNAFFPAHSQTKCRAGKQLHIKDGGKLQNPRNDLICVFLCALTAVSFCYNGIFIVMIIVCACHCCSTSKLVSLQLLAFDSFQCYYFRNKAFVYEQSLNFVFVHIQFSKQQIINAYWFLIGYNQRETIKEYILWMRIRNLFKISVHQWAHSLNVQWSWCTFDSVYEIWFVLLHKSTTCMVR